MGLLTTLFRFLSPIVYLEAVVGVVFAAECAYFAASADIHMVDLIAEGRLAILQMTVLAIVVGGALSLLSAILSLFVRLEVRSARPIACALAAMAMLVSIAAFVLPVRASHASRPDVLLIVLDTLRADFVTADRAPHLTRLRRSGVDFKNAHTVSPWTLPSFGTILTGLFPREHRAGMVGDRSSMTGPARNDVSTLAEEFLDAGYQTVSLTTNPHLRAENGLGRGFQSHRNLMLDNMSFSASFPLRESNQFSWGPMQTMRAKTWFALRDPERPMFMLLHYMDLHTPRRPSPALIQLELEAGTPAGEQATYGAAVRAMDDAVGELIDSLDAAGRLAEMIVVVTSDHGEGLEASGERSGHGNSLFPELTRALLVFRLAAAADHRGSSCDGVTSLVDLASTTAKLAGLQSEIGTRKVLIAEDGRCNVVDDVAFFGATTKGPQRDGLLDGQYALILTWPDKLELFDRLADPDYRSPLDEHSVELQAALRAHVNAQRGLAEGSELPSPTALSPVIKQQLEELGYIE